MEQFIRHLIYDVLAKKTIDKVLKLVRKLVAAEEVGPEAKVNGKLAAPAPAPTRGARR